MVPECCSRVPVYGHSTVRFEASSGVASLDSLFTGLRVVGRSSRENASLLQGSAATLMNCLGSRHGWCGSKYAWRAECPAIYSALKLLSMPAKPSSINSITLASIAGSSDEKLADQVTRAPSIGSIDNVEMKLPIGSGASEVL